MLLLPGYVHRKIFPHNYFGGNSPYFPGYLQKSKAIILEKPFEKIYQDEINFLITLDSESLFKGTPRILLESKYLFTPKQIEDIILYIDEDLWLSDG